MPENLRSQNGVHVDIYNFENQTAVKYHLSRSPSLIFRIGFFRFFKLKWSFHVPPHRYSMSEFFRVPIILSAAAASKTENSHLYSTTLDHVIWLETSLKKINIQLFQRQCPIFLGFNYFSLEKWKLQSPFEIFHDRCDFEIQKNRMSADLIFLM